ncbi:hypothetical protein FKM82_008079 [Ascaphus truei]
MSPWRLGERKKNILLCIRDTNFAVISLISKTRQQPARETLSCYSSYFIEDNRVFHFGSWLNALAYGTLQRNTRTLRAVNGI